MDKHGSDVTQDNGAVILPADIVHHVSIGNARRREPVLSNTGEPECPANVEALNRNNVKGIDPGILIHISGHQRTSG